MRTPVEMLLTPKTVERSRGVLSSLTGQSHDEPSAPHPGVALRRLYRCPVCRSKTTLSTALPCEPCWDAYLSGDARLLLLRLAMRPARVGRIAHGLIMGGLWEKLHRQKPG